MIRQAISPRLAIRIFLNFRDSEFISAQKSQAQSPTSNVQRPWLMAAFWTLDLGLLPNAEERLAVFHRLAILDVYLYHLAACFCLNLIHQLHCLDNANY